jgi:hypothetical protein
MGEYPILNATETRKMLFHKRLHAFGEKVAIIILAERHQHPGLGLW